MADPRRSKFNPSTTVQWSDGTNFDGWILVGVVPPTFSGTDSAYVSFSDGKPVVRLPVFAFVPITDGKFHTSSSVIFTSDLQPPNTKYVVWYYDSIRRQIAGPSSAVTVTADPFTPPSLTLTAPTAGSTNPTPD